MAKHKDIIGYTEQVDFPNAKIIGVLAKIDTGAYRTSVWATDIYEKNNELFFKLLGPASLNYSGHQVSIKSYQIVDVENSFGHTQKRYSIMMSIRIKGRRVRTNVTLSDRGNKTFPVLIGRKLLRGKFIVDVSKLNSLRDEEFEK